MTGDLSMCVPCVLDSSLKKDHLRYKADNGLAYISSLYPCADKSFIKSAG